MVGKKMTRMKKRDHNETHSFRRKCLRFLSRHVKQQSLLVETDL